MIQTIIQVAKPGVDLREYRAGIDKKLARAHSEWLAEGSLPEGTEVLELTEENFEEHWNNCDGDKNDEKKERFLLGAKEGRAFVIEIDW